MLSCPSVVSSYPHRLAPANHWSVFYLHGIIQYVAFWVCLLQVSSWKSELVDSNYPAGNWALTGVLRVPPIFLFWGRWRGRGVESWGDLLPCKDSLLAWNCHGRGLAMGVSQAYLPGSARQTWNFLALFSVCSPISIPELQASLARWVLILITDAQWVRAQDLGSSKTGFDSWFCCWQVVWHWAISLIFLRLHAILCIME